MWAMTWGEIRCNKMCNILIFLSSFPSFPPSIQPWTTCCRPWRWRGVLGLSGQAASRTLTALREETPAWLVEAGAAGSAWRSLPSPPTPSTVLPSPCPLQGIAEPSFGFRSKVRVLILFVGGVLLTIYKQQVHHPVLCLNRKCVLWRRCRLIRWPQESR